MKIKRWKRLVAMLLALVCLVTTACAVANTETTNRTENTEAILKKYEIIAVENGNVPSSITSKISLENFDTLKTANYLFDKDSFDSVVSSSKEIKELIKQGSLIAVYSEDGVGQDYEEMLGLPIGFICDQDEHMTDEPMLAVGKIYYTDSNGYPSVARYNVTESEIREETYDKFLAYLDSFASRSNMASDVATMAVADSFSTTFIGSIADFFEGSSNKGTIQVVYEVETAQDISGYDYYLVHAYVDATPGDALYGNGYDLDELSMQISTSTTDAVLYKTGPNTTSGGNTYNVDIGFTGSKDSKEVTINAGWSRDMEDVSISKINDSLNSCSWVVDLNDWEDVADSTYTFEPGGTFRIPNSNGVVKIRGTYSMTVDSSEEPPSEAISDRYGSFFCNPNLAWA